MLTIDSKLGNVLRNLLDSKYIARHDADATMTRICDVVMADSHCLSEISDAHFL